MTRRTRTDARAAIVCEHVAGAGAPIKIAVRDEPEDEVDSGWQFLCGMVREEDMHRAKVWAVDEVLEVEPTLADHIDDPAGTTLMRTGPHAPWSGIRDDVPSA